MVHSVYISDKKDSNYSSTHRARQIWQTTTSLCKKSNNNAQTLQMSYAQQMAGWNEKNILLQRNLRFGETVDH